MKTKADYIAEFDAYRAALRRLRILPVMIMTFVLAALLEKHWIASQFGNAVGDRLKLILLFAILGLTFWQYRRRKETDQKSGLVCSVCGESLLKGGRPLKEIFAENVCPICGKNLFPA